MSEKAKDIARRKIVERNMASGKDAEQASAEADALLGAVEAKDNYEAENYNFGADFVQFCLTEPFLATISAGVSRIVDYDVPTAYVGVRPNGRRYEIVMGYNPNFFSSLTPRQRLGVLKHEMFHLAFHHLFERAPANEDYAVMWNWATDLAINSIIGQENLPYTCLIPGKQPIDPATGKPIEGPYAEFIEKAPKMKSSDFYFSKFRGIEEQQRQEGNPDSVKIAVGNGMSSIDEHREWGTLPVEVQQQVTDKVRELLEEAAKNADRTNNWGSVPAETAEIIRKLLSREVDWRSILRQFIGRCRSMERDSTVKRLNKKAPYKMPGYRRRYKANFVCFIDQSGSMSDNDIALLFGELGSLASLTDIDVYHFDTEIDETSHAVWKKGRPIPIPHRTRCGGTDFESIRNFLHRPENRARWSGAIILTDGYAPTMGQVIGTRIMWVITEAGTLVAVRPGDLAVQMKKERQFRRY